MADEFTGVDPDVEMARMASEGLGFQGESLAPEEEQLINIPWLGIDIPKSRARDPEYIRDLIWERLGTRLSQVPEAAAGLATGVEEGVTEAFTGLGYRAVGKEPPKGPPPKPIGPETLRAGLRAPWEVAPGAQIPGAQVSVGGAEARRVSGPAMGLGPLGRVMRSARELGAGARERGGERIEAIQGATERQTAAAREIELQKGMTAEAAAGIGMQLEADIAGGEQAYTTRREGLSKKKQAAWGKFNNIQQRMATASVDPQRYFKDGGAFWAGMAALFGAFGQAFQRTAGDPQARNAGVDAMMRAIDNDIAAQEVEIRKLGMEATVANNVLARWQAELGDADAARVAAKMSLIQQAQRMIHNVQQQGAAAMAPEMAEMTASQLEAENAKLAGELDARFTASATQALNIEAQTARTAATIAESRRVRMAKEQAGAGLYPVAGLRVFDPSRPIPSKTDISKVRTYWPQYKTVRRELVKLIEFRRRHGAGLSVGPEYAKAAQHAHKLILVLKKHEEMGAHFTPMEEELLLISRDPKKFGYLLDGYEERLKIVDNESLDWLQYGMNATPEVVTGK